jgi:leader peptidase (prepilin peptidase)/N-methyltransferase
MTMAAPALPPMLFAFAFVFGAIIGSFLNVCIWRLPRDESIVHPGSHCPQCGAPVRPVDNIPLLSYALLRGRCRQCATPISFRYPLVEILMGLLIVVLLHRFGVSPAFVAYTVFTAALVVVSFIDLDHQIIPDVISLPGIAVGLACSLLGIGPSILDSAAGALLGGGLLLAVAVGYHALTKREGMGGGDIKLLAMIGAFLGWRAVLVTLVLGSLSGALVGMALIVGRGAGTRVPIPFGPFLALGAICALLFGDSLIEWYLSFAFYGMTEQ